VVPIYKNGNKSWISNYRPVSVLPCLSKILERLLHKRINDFIVKYDILYKYQFGFREKHGTNLALSILIDNIINAHEKGQCVLGIFIDFSKAFDTINHQILYTKLENYGIRGNALKWIRSYLTGRTQFVQYNGISSDYDNITCGVPQGSILGPLFFILYINDIVNVCSKTLPILFADDTNMFIAGNDIDLMIRTMNIELDNVVKWLHANKLSLNVKKTHYVIFKPGRTHVTPTVDICINQQIILREYCTTFLGVVLDAKLSWNHHIQKIKLKMSKNIGLLCKVRKILSKTTLITLYYSFIYPYINYCIEIWGNAAKRYTNTILKLQKLCCRFITGSKRQTASDPLFKSLNILKINEVYEYCTMLFMFKYYRGMLPAVSKKIFQIVDLSHSITRQTHNFILPLCNSQVAYNSMKFQGPKIWNQYHKQLNIICTFNTFKHNLKKLITSKT